MPIRKRKYGGASGYRSRKSRGVRRRLFGSTMRRRRGAMYRGRKKLMSNIAISIAESKERVVQTPFLNSLSGTSLTHNNLYKIDLHDASSGSTSIPTLLAQGNQSDQRNGVEIYSRGFRVRGVFNVPQDRRGVTIKIWLCEYNTAQGDPQTKSMFFLPGGSDNLLIRPIDNHRFPGTRLLRTLRVKARDRYAEDTVSYDSTVYFDVWIPWRRHLRYAGSSSFAPASGAKERLSLIVGVYDTTETSSTTDLVVTKNETTSVFYYKDP